LKVSILENIAKERTIEQTLLRERQLVFLSQAIGRALKRVKFPFDPVDFEFFHVHTLGDVQDFEWLRIIKTAIDSLHGSPMKLFKSQLREHASQFYNPTGHVLNVEPMGMPDENGQIIKTLPPCGIMMIPHSYQVGGKRSTVKTCCPQLQPIPKINQYENLLDASPNSYAEWLAYYPAMPTLCCGKSIVWSDALQAPFCISCRKPVCMADYWSRVQ
jgi:hypothetical protein